MPVKYLATNQIAMMCRQANIPGLFIDMEHSALSLAAAAQLILACNYAGISPLVRVPSQSPWARLRSR